MKDKVRDIFRKAIFGLGLDFESLKSSFANNETTQGEMGGIMVLFLGALSVVYENTSDAPDDLTVEYVFGLQK